MPGMWFFSSSSPFKTEREKFMLRIVLNGEHKSKLYCSIAGPGLLLKLKWGKSSFLLPSPLMVSPHQTLSCGTVLFRWEYANARRECALVQSSHGSESNMWLLYNNSARMRHSPRPKLVVLLVQEKERQIPLGTCQKWLQAHLRQIHSAIEIWWSLCLGHACLDWCQGTM